MLVAAAMIADLCSTPAPPAPRDPEDAESYVRVGDDARAAGDVRIAATAYRAALARNPDDIHARAALAELCRADSADPDTDHLLAAIAAYTRGDLEVARSALRSLVEAGASTSAGAHFFLGLIALGSHAGGEAVRELEAARVDPTYEPLTRDVLRLAHRDGRLSAIALVAGEVDTNPQLVPDTPPAGATTGPRASDEDLLGIVTATMRPLRWLVLRDVVVSRTQRTVRSLDYFANTLQAGLELDGRADHLAVRYELDDALLGGDAYLVANRGSLTYRHELGSLALVGAYAVRRRDYQQSALTPFDGWSHNAGVGALVHATSSLDIEGQLVGARDLAKDAEFSDVTLGGQLSVRARVGSRTRLSAIVAGWSARYDAAQPDGLERRDNHGEASVDVEVDLGNHWIAVCGTSALVNESTIDDFDYWKLVVRCGPAFAIGGP
jgi:tetratricopeptide (TPR) repeat protein